MSLKKQLEELTSQFKAKIPEQGQTVMAQALDNLVRSNVVDQVLKEGQSVSDFSLPNAIGNTVNLHQLVSEGPVVVTFYRGSWCPYCNLTLKELEKFLPAMQAQGAKLVAISPELPDKSLSAFEKEKLTFDILTDTGNKVARQFGIVYKLPPELAALYKDFNIDIAKSNGDLSYELPLAATFIIGNDKKIKYVFIDADYKKRAEPEDIVSTLKCIAGNVVIESK